VRAAVRSRRFAASGIDSYRYERTLTAGGAELVNPIEGMTGHIPFSGGLPALAWWRRCQRSGGTRGHAPAADADPHENFREITDSFRPADARTSRG